jgi:beta-lactam-binding protein with PASTA domain
VTRFYWLAVAVPLLFSGCFGASSASQSSVRSVRVPTVTRTYLNAATRRLHASGLRVVLESVPPLTRADYSDNGYAVDGQSPPAGSMVVAGTTVELRISTSVNAGDGGLGPPGIVPNLVGVPVNRALYMANTAGLLVTVSGVSHPVTSTVVKTQSLSPGAPVAKGQVITLTL